MNMEMDIVEYDEKAEADYQAERRTRVRHSSYNNNVSPLGRLSNASMSKRNGTLKLGGGLLQRRSGTIARKTKGSGLINGSGVERLSTGGNEREDSLHD